MVAKKTIGFFGNSYCAYYDGKAVEKWQYPQIKAFYEANPSYITYVKKVVDDNDYELINLGSGGASIWDTISLQLQPLINEECIPDVCVFVWTASRFFYNKKVRGLSPGRAHNPEHFVSGEYSGILEAYKQYCDHLYDKDWHDYIAKATFYYFDNNVLSSFPATTKIIHLWTYPNSIIHRWKNGVEIRPALSVVTDNENVPLRDDIIPPNHFNKQETNDMLANILKEAISNYEPGKLINIL